MKRLGIQVGALAVLAILGVSAALVAERAPSPASSQAAATALGDAQGIPPGHVGSTYPDDPLCWIVFDGKFYGSGQFNPPVNCRGGYSGLSQAFTFFSGVFSLSTGSSPQTGKSVYLTSTYYDPQYFVGPYLGPNNYAYYEYLPGCPDGYTASYEDYGGYGVGTITCRKGTGRSYSAATTPASYCYGYVYYDEWAGWLQRPDHQPYPFPPGYNPDLGDKIDYRGGSTGAFTATNNNQYFDQARCYAWKWTDSHVDSTPTAAGTAPSVAPGGQLTFEWSCLPYRQVMMGSCRYNQWDSHCRAQSGPIYSLSPLVSSVSGGGSGFVPPSGSLNGAQTITAPSTAGVYTYSLTCAGAWNLPPMSISVAVGDALLPTDDPNGGDGNGDGDGAGNCAPGTPPNNCPPVVCGLGTHKNSGGACVPNTCTDPHAIAPLCSTCISGYEMKNNSCTLAPPKLSLSASPSRVSPGKTTQISWGVTDLVASAGVSCSVSSNPAGKVSATMPLNTAPAWSGTAQTAAITGTTIITLSCTGAESKSITVGLIPSVIEI